MTRELHLAAQSIICVNNRASNPEESWLKRRWKGPKTIQKRVVRWSEWIYEKHPFRGQALSKEGYMGCRGWLFSTNLNESFLKICPEGQCCVRCSGIFRSDICIPFSKVYSWIEFFNRQSECGELVKTLFFLWAEGSFKASLAHNQYAGISFCSTLPNSSVGHAMSTSTMDLHRRKSGPSLSRKKIEVETN